MNDAMTSLSEAGRERRIAMLPTLEAAMLARVRRRRAVRIAAVILVAGAALWVMPRRAPTLSPPVAAAEPALHMDHATLRVVAQQTLTFIRPVDDDTLLRELRASGRPTGLVRTAGRVMLTEDIGADDPGPS